MKSARFSLSTADPFDGPPWAARPLAPGECRAGGDGAYHCSVGPADAGCSAVCAFGYRSCCASDGRCACLDAASFLEAP